MKPVSFFCVSGDAVDDIVLIRSSALSFTLFRKPEIFLTASGEAGRVSAQIFSYSVWLVKPCASIVLGVMAPYSSVSSCTIRASTSKKSTCPSASLGIGQVVKPFEISELFGSKTPKQFLNNGLPLDWCGTR